MRPAIFIDCSGIRAHIPRIMAMTFLRQIAIVATSALPLIACIANAAEIAVPTTVPQQVIPVQQNQPNCTRWTNDCVNCTRGSDGAPPTCSNIGFACQPNAIRCLGGDISQGERRN